MPVQNAVAGICLKKIMKKKIFICLILFVAVALANAQQVNSVFFNWNNSNSNYPAYMLAENFSQESNGILWLGGREGLWRFDGKHFQPFIYSESDSNSIPGNNIAAQYISGNTLYGGCFGNGFFTMDLKTLQVNRILLSGSDKHKKLSVTAIAAKGEDSLWLAVSDRKLICINKNNFQERKNFALIPMAGEDINKEMVLDIIPSRFNKNKLWLLCNKTLLLVDEITGRYQSFSFSVENDLGQLVRLEQPTDIVEENDSTAIISFFKSGILKWNFKKNKYNRFTYTVNAPRIQNNSINGIIEKGPREYFVSGSDSGLYTFNSISEKFTREYNSYRAAPPVFKNPTRQLFKDIYGGIWISMIGGISYWHPKYQNVLAYSMPSYIQPTVASSIQLFENNILVTRRDRQHPLILFHQQTQSWSFPQKNNLSNDYIRIKTNWRKGYLYKSVADNWYSYDVATRQLKPWLPGIPTINLKQLQTANENERYQVYLLKDSLVVLNKKSGKLFYHGFSEKPDSLQSKRLYFSLIDDEDRVWIATSTGLTVYNLVSQKFKELSFKTDKKLKGLETVIDIQLSKKAELYAATQENGIFVFDTKTGHLLEQFNKENGLTENYVHNILLDDSGKKLIAATLSGLTVIDLNNKTTRRWDKYNSGLQIEDGFFGICSSSKNELYAGDSVLYKINISADTQRTILPFVSGYLANKKYYTGSNLIKLDKETAYVELFLSIGYFADNAHLHLQYCLQNNKEWNTVENGKIIIPDLKNGNTNIRLRAILNGVVNAYGENNITIKRGLFYYQTIWFKATLAALLMVILFITLKTRINQVRKQEQEKASLQHKIDQMETISLRSQMNPHFIFNTLSSLRYLILLSDTKKASSFILKLSKLLRMIMIHSREQNIPLQEELDFLRLYLEIEALRFDNKFSFSIKIDETADIFDIRIPPLLLQPFVENAIKHGLVNSLLPKKWIEISMSKINDNDYVFTITDNGIGRHNAALLNKNREHQSLGTIITDERISLFNKLSTPNIHYTIENYCNDALNSGTVVKIYYETISKNDRNHGV